MIAKKLSVVIPCYNSEKTIKIVVQNVIDALTEQNMLNYEIILINDGSVDNTWKVLKELSLNNSKIISINFSQNFGQHSALMAGYRFVSGDVVLGLDDDGEHNPYDFMKLLDKLDDEHDYVCADYSKSEKRSLFRRFGTFLNNFMATIFIKKPSDVNFSSFYVMKRYVVDEIAKCKNPFPYIAGSLLQCTRKIGMVKLNRTKRIEGTSNYNLLKMAKLFVNGFTAFSIVPLRVSTFIGFFTASMGFIWCFILLLKKIFFEIQLGYTSLMAGSLFFFGIIMILLGIIGEYIGRIYMCLNSTQQYVIKDVINSHNK